MLLVFDLDLTLCDNSLRKRSALERVLGPGIAGTESGQLRNEMVEDILRDLRLDREMTRRVMHHFFFDEDLFDLDVPLEEAPEVLRGLAAADHALYYVTGRPLRRTAEAFLSRFTFPPAPLYSDFVGPGESWKKVRLFKEIREREGGAPGIAIGDLVGDALAAREAGLFAVGTLQAPERVHTRTDLEEVCDALIGHIREFPALLEQVERMWKLPEPGPAARRDAGGNL